MIPAHVLSDALTADHWIASALMGAAIAALGFVGKQLVDLVLSLQRNRQAQRARLIHLHSLLRASRAAFGSQRALAQRLIDSLRMSHPDITPRDGLENTFTLYADRLSDKEKDLHSIIRGITVHSIRPLNLAMSKWLDRDRAFKAEQDRAGRRTELAIKLADLEAHLILWHAKYKAWIPGHNDHALVYLADEQEHGIGFPAGIDDVVEHALSARRISRLPWAAE